MHATPGIASPSGPPVAGLLLLAASAQKPPVKDKIWSPPSPDELTRLTQRASQGAVEEDGGEAVNQLIQTTFAYANALKEAQEDKRRVQAKLDEALLVSYLAPIRPNAVKEANPPPATEGPDSESWPPFLEWELRQSLPVPQFSLYQRLLARREDFSRLIASTPENMAAFDAQLSKLRAVWQSDQPSLTLELGALPRATELAQARNQAAIRFHEHRTAALLAIQDVRQKALTEIVSLFVPFTALVTLCSDTIKFATNLDLQSVDLLGPPSDEYQALLARFSDFNQTHPNLFTDSVDDEWKPLKEKARLIRSELADNLNAVLFKLMRKRVELEILGFVKALDCPDFEKLLRQHFLLLNEIKLWKTPQKIVPESSDLLQRCKKLLKDIVNLESRQVKIVSENMPKTLKEDPKVKYQSVLEAPVLHFSTVDENRVSCQLKALQKELINLWNNAKVIPVKLDDDLQVFELIEGASNAKLAELMVRMTLLLREMESSKAEFSGHADKALLALQFSAFSDRYARLEKEMNLIIDGDFKQWQDAVKKAVNQQKAHWELLDIQKLGHNLSFEMRHFQVAVTTGKFQYVTWQATKEFLSKPNQFPWRGPNKA